MNDNNDFQEFLEGGKIPENGYNDFSKLYANLIEQAQSAEQPDFNPLKKVKQKRKIRRLKQIFSYAAIIVVIFGFSVVLYHYLPQRPQKSNNKIQLAEAHKNTIYALSHFSQEWNSCLLRFEDAKKLQQPVNEFESLKNIKIELKNPVQKIKLN